MARHRNVRSMKYDDDDDFDDLYGHSVEDDYCISPGTAAQFTYDRSSRQQLDHYMSATKPQDIPEEDVEYWEEDDGTGSEKDPPSRQDSFTFQRPPLSSIDEAKLNSCLEEMRNILGDTIQEHIMIDAVLKTDFSYEAALNMVLNTKEVPKQQRTPRKDRESKVYESSLEEDVCSETSGTFQRVLVSIIQGGRDQKEAAEVDQGVVMQDAEELYNSGEGKFGTDEDVFNRIFALRSWAHLRGVCEQYRIKAGRELEETIEREFVFNEKKAFLAIVKYARDPCQYFADRIHASLKDDNDDSLTRLIVAHAETDLVTIMERFTAKYGQKVEEVIKEECRGDFCKLLLRIINPTLSFK